MKIREIVVFSVLCLVALSLSGFKVNNGLETSVFEMAEQDGLVVFASFDGKEDYGYNFITKDKDNEEHTLTFQKVDDSVLQAFDLNSNTFLGTTFKITFKKEIVITKDEDGFDDENEIKTIVSLEKK